MGRRGPAAWAAAVAALALAAAGCSDITAEDIYVPAVPVVKPVPDARIFQPSDVRGGTVRLGRVGDWDALDPAMTRQPYARNFLRNYSRTLTVVRAAPAPQWTSLKADKPASLLAPDLAEGLGRTTDGGRTWTYVLRPGVRYEDGSAIESGHFKHAFERALAQRPLEFGGRKLADTLKAIRTPDARTVVYEFHDAVLNVDYLAQLPFMAPVPPGHQPGDPYRPLASGPYKFATIEPGKRLVLERNKRYDSETDPDSGRAPLADRLEVVLNLPAQSVADQLAAGSLDMEVAGEERPAGQVAGQVLGAGQGELDTASLPTLAYTMMSDKVDPLFNQECRRAVIVGADKAAYLAAYGGESVASIATGLLPPSVYAAVPPDPFRLLATPKGDVPGARAALKACSAPDGFRTKAAYRADQPADKAAAEALKTSLARAGITLDLVAFPSASFAAKFTGKSDYAQKNKFGLAIASRTARTADGLSLLVPLLDGSSTGVAANVDIRGVDRAGPLLTNAKSADATARANAWRELDSVAAPTGLIFPAVWGHNTLRRPRTLTNIFVNDGFAMYDYATLGKVRR